MKTFSNVNPKSVPEAVKLLGQPGRTAVIIGGGSDLLGMVKERLVQPDVLVNLKAIPSLDRITEQGGEVRIGGLTIGRDYGDLGRLRRGGGSAPAAGRL